MKSLGLILALIFVTGCEGTLETVIDQSGHEGVWISNGLHWHRNQVLRLEVLIPMLAQDLYRESTHDKFMFLEGSYIEAVGIPTVLEQSTLEFALSRLAAIYKIQTALDPFELPNSYQAHFSTSEGQWSLIWYPNLGNDLSWRFGEIAFFKSKTDTTSVMDISFDSLLIY